MAVTVTPIVGGPPAVEVTVTGGATMTAATLKRTANGTTEKAPIQPKTGVTSSTVQDYLIPWDVDVVYTATVTTAGGTTTYTAAAVNLSATDAWAIHPVFPQRSITIDRQNPTGGIVVAGWTSTTRPAEASEHRIVGNPFPVFTTIGSRQSLRGTLTLFAERQTDRDSVTLLIDDQTPILFRYPASIGAGWEDGFYNVGDYTEDQIGPRGGGWWKISLALTRVQPPAVTTVAGWDYPTITATFADYADLTASFADYQALTADREL
jgi:hypothetical protein